MLFHGSLLKPLKRRWSLAGYLALSRRARESSRILSVLMLITFAQTSFAQTLDWSLDQTVERIELLFHFDRISDEYGGMYELSLKAPCALSINVEGQERPDERQSFSINMADVNLNGVSVELLGNNGILPNLKTGTALVIPHAAFNFERVPERLKANARGHLYALQHWARLCGAQESDSGPSERLTLTDDRFSIGNGPDWLDIVFENTGVVSAPECTWAGTGFYADGGVYTNKHVVCGQLSRGCDMSELTLSNMDTGLSIPLDGTNLSDICSVPEAAKPRHEMTTLEILQHREDIERHVSGQAIFDFVKIDPISSPESLTGLNFAGYPEIFTDLIMRRNEECFVVGYNVNNAQINATQIVDYEIGTGRIGNFFELFSANYIRHCGATQPGFSGSPMVCRGTYGTRVIAIHAQGSKNTQNDRIIPQGGTYQCRIGPEDGLAVIPDVQ